MTSTFTAVRSAAAHGDHFSAFICLYTELHDNSLLSQEPEGNMVRSVFISHIYHVFIKSVLRFLEVRAKRGFGRTHMMTVKSARAGPGGWGLVEGAGRAREVRGGGCSCRLRSSCDSQVQPRVVAGRVRVGQSCLWISSVRKV